MRTRLSTLPVSGTAAYRTLGCMFNHATVHANLAPSDEVHCMRIALDDPRMWCRMDVDSGSETSGPAWTTVPLLGCPHEPVEATEIRLEHLLRVRCLCMHKTGPTTQFAIGQYAIVLKTQSC